MFGSIKLIAILIIVCIIAAGLWYVSSLKASLAVSQENVNKLSDGITAQQQVIEQQREDIQKIQEINSELNNELTRQQQEIQALNKKFNTRSNGETRDFAKLAADKPGLVEKLINRGTANALRCLEIASGAPLTTDELDARSTSKINPECPTLANPNYKPVMP